MKQAKMQRKIYAVMRILIVKTVTVEKIFYNFFKKKNISCIEKNGHPRILEF